MQIIKTKHQRLKKHFLAAKFP